MNILSVILSFFGLGKKNPIDSINDLLGRSPDAIAQKIELEKTQQAPALQQIELNKIEARNKGFQGGWRPLLGYVCVLALLQTYVVLPLLVIIFQAHGKMINIPVTNLYDLITMLIGLLGIIPGKRD